MRLEGEIGCSDETGRKTKVKSLRLDRMTLYIVQIRHEQEKKENPRNWKINLLIDTNDVCCQNVYN